MPDQAVNSGEQGPRAIPGTVQRHIVDNVVNSRSENGRKSRKRRISECLTVCCLTVFPPMKVSCFLVGSQDVSHEASADQQALWRKYGGMRNDLRSLRPRHDAP